MIYVPREASSEQVLEIIRAWIDILSREDYEAAFEAIGAWGSHWGWTVEALRDDIKNYRSPEFYPGVEDFRVTDWRMAQGGNPEAEQTVLWYDRISNDNFPLAGAITFDLPLNGRWSSLTADFVIFKGTDTDEGDILGLEEIYSWEQRATE